MRSKMKQTYRYTGTKTRKIEKALKDIRFYLGDENQQALIDELLEAFPYQSSLTYSQAKALVKRTRLYCLTIGIQGFPVYAFTNHLFQIIKNR